MVLLQAPSTNCWEVLLVQEPGLALMAEHVTSASAAASRAGLQPLVWQHIAEPAVHTGRKTLMANSQRCPLVLLPAAAL